MHWYGWLVLVVVFCFLGRSCVLDGGHRRAAEVLAGMEVTWLEDIDGDIVRSLNTPDDYLRFRTSVGPGDN